MVYFICKGNGCRHGVGSAGFTAYVRRKHKVTKEIWQQVEEYITGFSFEYGYSIVEMLEDGLAALPIIYVVDRFECNIYYLASA